MILFPASNYQAASVDKPAVWRTTRSQVKPGRGKQINVSAMRLFEQADNEREMYFSQQRDWAVCFFTGQNTIAACTEPMKMSLTMPSRRPRQEQPKTNADFRRESQDK